jgi:hypothetical protein
MGCRDGSSAPLSPPTARHPHKTTMSTATQADHHMGGKQDITTLPPAPACTLQQGVIGSWLEGGTPAGKRGGRNDRLVWKSKPPQKNT